MSGGGGLSQKVLWHLYGWLLMVDKSVNLLAFRLSSSVDQLRYFNIDETLLWKL